MGKTTLIQILLILIGQSSISQSYQPVAGDTSGYTMGSFNVSDGGAATYNVPLIISPGTANLQPSLSLSYNNQTPNSILGVGWAVEGFSAISRAAQTMAQDGQIKGIAFNNTDRIALDGERLVAVDPSSTYGSNGSEYRTEQNNFHKIICMGSSTTPDYFTVYTKSGLIMEYGRTGDAKVILDGRTILHWLINKITDRFGNYYTYSYAQNALTGEYYPREINYTGNSNTGLLPYASVKFEYEQRADSAHFYLNGMRLLKNTKRLKSINCFFRTVLVRSYAFTYQYSPSNFSQLISFKECGKNGSCHTPTLLNWTNSAVLTFNSVPLSNIQQSTTSNRLINTDLNADGVQDLLKIIPSGNLEAYVSNKSLSNLALANTPINPAVNVSNKLVMADFNGDGRPDFLIYDSVSGTHSIRMNSTVAGTTQITNEAVSSPIPLSALNNKKVTVALDANGDGRSDLLTIDPTNGNNYLLISTTVSAKAVTFQQNGQTNYFTNLLPASYFQNGFQPFFVDFTGDGLTDVLFYQPANGNTALYINSGGGSVTYTLAASNIILPSQINVDGGAFSMPDINADGLPDLMYYVRNTGLNLWWLNQGNNTFVSQIVTSINLQITGGTNLFLIDANGDGYTDLLWFDKASGTNRWFINNGKLNFIQFNNIIPTTDLTGYDVQSTGNFTSNSSLDLFLYNDSTTVKAKILRGATGLSNVVTQIIPGNKQSIDISYDPLTSDSLYTKDNNSLYPLMDYQAPQYVVKNWRTTDGIGGKRTVSFRYSGAKLHLGGRGFRGYSQVDVIDEATGIIQSKTFSNGPDAWQYVSSPLVKEVKRLSNGTIIGQTDIINGLKTYCNGKSFFSFVKSSSSKTYELDGSFVDSLLTVQTFDDYGNVLNSVTTYGTGVQDSLVTISNNNASTWILGRMVSSRLYRKNGNQPVIVKSSAFTYDSTSGTGVLIKEVSEPDSSNRVQIVKTYQRDSYGNIVQSAETAWNGTSLETHTTSTGYDLLKRFVISISNPQGHISFQTYDSCLGHLLTVKNPNSQITQQYYDSFGRLIKTVKADGTWTTLDYRKCQKDFGWPKFGSHYVIQQSSNSTPVITYYDTLNRAVRIEKRGFSGAVVYTDMSYNSKGFLEKESEPYLASVYNNIPPTQFFYDELGRMVRKIAPGNPVDSIKYNGRTTTYINARNQKKVIIKDAKEQIILSRDNQNNEIKYSYDAAGRLLQIADLVGNLIKMEYDVYGHLIKLADPDLGVRSYVTNGFSQLVSSTKGSQVTNYRYDSLGRLRQRIEPEGTTKYYYDTQQFSIGLLDSIVSYNYYKEAYTYDSLNRIKTLQKRIDSQWYSQVVTYDLKGRIATTTDATGFSVTNLYTANGYLGAVKRTNTSDTFWKATVLNVKDQIERQVFGNGVETYKYYNPYADYIQSITATKGETQLSYLYYTYDALNNMNYRWDGVMSVGESFQLDDLNRLMEYRKSGSAYLNPILIKYDAIGNITSKSDVGTYTYGGVNNGPHRLISVTGPNTQCIPSLLVNTQYNSFDKVKEITKDSIRVSISYSPDHQRYLQLMYDSGRLVRKKIYVSSAFEKEIKGGDTIITHFINTPEGIIAAYTTHSKVNRPASTDYFYRDNQGSIVMVTNDTGKVVARFSFDAWGKRRNADWSNTLTDTNHLMADRGFTGHEHYDLFELVDMNGRMYDPVLGRFTSADPIIQDPTDLQCLNRYSYCNNNPTTYTDPSGYSWRHPFRHIFHWFSSATKFIEKNLKTIATTTVAVAVGTLTGGVGITLGGAFLSGASVGFASTATGTLLNGGSLGDALKAGIRGSIISSFSAGTSFVAGEIYNSSSTTLLNYKKIVSSGVIQGGTSVAGGGKFVQGFYSGIFTSASSPYVSTMTGYNTRVVASAIIGGTVSQVSGGQFANGAVTGAFVRMYNEEEHWGVKDNYYNGKGIGRTNYTGPSDSPEDPRWLLANGLLPKDELDLAAYQHDVAYYDAKTGGVIGAFFNTSVLYADINLINAARSTIYKYDNRSGIDSWTGRHISERTYNMAKAVNLTFSITVFVKENSPF